MNSAQAFVALRFEPLERATSQLVQEPSLATGEKEPIGSSTIQGVRDSGKDILDKNEWLVEPNQSIELPSTKNNSSKKVFSLSDFVVRTDAAIQKDLRAASLDEQGQMRRLSEAQQEELRQTGTITVPSIYIKNQSHVWRVAPWFYSGRQTIQQSRLGGLGAGLDHIAVYSWSDTEKTTGLPSWPRTIRKGVVKPVQKVLGAVRQLVSAPFRPLKYNENTVEPFVAAAERGYVRYHLEQQGFNSSHFGSQELAGASDAVWDELEKVWEPAVECRPSEECKKLAREANLHVMSERARFESSRPHVRTAEFDEKKAMESPYQARREHKRAREALRLRRNQELIDHLRGSQDPLLQAEAKAIQIKCIERELLVADEKEIQELLDAKAEQYKKRRPILSLSKAWLQRAISRHRTHLKSSSEASRSKRLLEKLSEDDGLEAQREVLRLREKFQDQEAPGLRSTLMKERMSPKRTFRILSLDSRRWKVSRSGQVDRYEKREVSLDKWGWRIRVAGYIFLQTFRTLSASACHFLLSGPLSMRALFSPQAYYALKRPLISGDMEDDPSSLTPTLASRLGSFFQSLRDARQRFEAQPETGLIDKSIQRFFFKLKTAATASIGSVLIVSFMILGTSVSSAVAGLTVVASPVLAAAGTLLSTIFELVIFDFSTGTLGPCLQLVRAGFDFAWHGVLQGVLATVRHVVVHPLIGLVHIGWAMGRATQRSLRDKLTGLVLFRNAKVPIDDTYIAKRIHGPGMASQTFYRLPLESAKQGVEMILHQALVDAHVRLRQAELQEPFFRYHRFMDTLLSPFGFKALLLAESPESVCARLCNVVERNNAIRSSSMGRRAGRSNFGGPWDAVGQKIRRAHPSVKAAMQESEETISLQEDVLAISDYDKEVVSQLKEAEPPLQLSNPYNVMSMRTGYLLAELHLRKKYRGDLTSRMVSLPAHARGKFRLSEQELQELWEFALRRTQDYGDRMERELSEIANGSTFKEQLEEKAKKICKVFWQEEFSNSASRVSVKASTILSELLGGDTMLEALEDVDKNLVVEPIFEEEKAHLVLWV